jgi:hypothetical protein
VIRSRRTSAITAFRQILQQAHPFPQRGLEVQLAIHRPRGDVGHMRADPRLVGQFVDAFLPDHRRIHVGDQQPLLPPPGALHHHVDAQRLQAVPDLPAVLRHARHRELRRHAGIKPARLAAAPGIAQAFDRDPVQHRGFGVGQQRDDGHGQVSDSERASLFRDDAAD